MAAFEFFKAMNFATNRINFNRNLKVKQVIALEHIFNDRHIFVNLPTGFGKSLIYQLGVFVLGYKKQVERPICIVISPLNSFIEDQVTSLGRQGVRACFLTGTSFDQNLYFPFIFVHAEWISGVVRKILLQKYFQDNVLLVAVDEAHCIVEWGPEFRKSYAQLGILASLFSNVTTVALTATAPKKYVKQIVSSLSLLDPALITTLPDRTNIYSTISKRLPSRHGNKSVEEILLPLAKNLKSERLLFPQTLVYMPFKFCGFAFRLFSNHLGPNEQFEPVGAHSPNNRLFGQFHSEYPEDMKTIILDSLVNDGKCRILFCTSAVGMGIDAPHIRQAIHIGVPRTIEQYYQETGRAGRDGLPSTAHLHFNATDIMKSRKDIHDSIRDLCISEDCIRTFVLKYFGCDTTHFKAKDVLHDCCSRCAALCECENCPVQRVEESLMDLSVCELGDTAATGAECENIDSEVRDRIHNEIIRYRDELQEHYVFSFTHGLTLETVDDIMSKLDEIYCFEDLMPPNVSLWNSDHARQIFAIISAERGWDFE